LGTFQDADRRWHFQQPEYPELMRHGIHYGSVVDDRMVQKAAELLVRVTVTVERERQPRKQMAAAVVLQVYHYIEIPFPEDFRKFEKTSQAPVLILEIAYQQFVYMRIAQEDILGPQPNKESYLELRRRVLFAQSPYAAVKG
jgi:hypothetical protein